MRISTPLAICCGVLLFGNAHAADLEDGFARAASYTSGQSREPLRRIERAVAASITNQTLRAELEAVLIRMLTAPASYETRKFACEQLAIVGSADAVPALAALLTDPNFVRVACLALQPNPSALADEALRAAQARGDARIQIIHTLGDRRDPKSVPPLAAIARGRDRAAAEAAIAALGKIGDDAAQAALVGLRADADPALAPALAEAFLRVAERRVAQANLAAARSLYERLLGAENAVAVRRGALTALLALDSDGGTRRILAVIKGSDSALQPTAIAAIDALVGADVSRAFGLELPNLNPQLRLLLIEALTARADAEARAAIASRINDENPAVRLGAIQALGRIGGAPSVPVLVSALVNAGAPEETAAVQSALVRLPPEVAVDQAILEGFAGAPAQAKAPLMVVLGQRRIRDAWPALLTEAGSPATAVARAAWQALGRLATADDAPALLARLNDLPATVRRDDAESAIARSLLQTGDVAARSALLRGALERAANVETRCSLLRLLPQAADVAALNTLESAARGADPLVVDAAVRALAQWPDSGAWDTLWLIYAQSSSVPHQSVALRALVRLAEAENRQPKPEWIARYRALIENARQPADRKLILGALGGLAHPDALELAVAQLENPEVRAEAALAVKGIAEAIKDQHPEAAREALRKMQ